MSKYSQERWVVWSCVIAYPLKTTLRPHIKVSVALGQEVDNFYSHNENYLMREHYGFYIYQFVVQWEARRTTITNFNLNLFMSPTVNMVRIPSKSCKATISTRVFCRTTLSHYQVLLTTQFRSSHLWSAVFLCNCLGQCTMIRRTWMASSFSWLSRPPWAMGYD